MTAALADTRDLPREPHGTFVASGAGQTVIIGRTNMALLTGDRGTPHARHGRRRVGLASARGQALVETAIAVPLLLLVSVLIFEFGRAYQVAQVITNAAREGARVAVLPNATAADVQSRVTTYLQAGAIGG